MELAVALVADVYNPDPGDLMLDVAGLEVVRSDLASEVAQRLTVRFNFFMGEWFMDLNAGTPWFQRLLVKAPSDLVIRTILGQVITECEGVADLVSFTYSINRLRQMSLSFKARLADGTLFKSTDYNPFVLDLSQIS